MTFRLQLLPKRINSTMLFRKQHLPRWTIFPSTLHPHLGYFLNTHTVPRICSDLGTVDRNSWVSIWRYIRIHYHHYQGFRCVFNLCFETNTLAAAVPSCVSTCGFNTSCVNWLQIGFYLNNLLIDLSSTLLGLISRVDL